MKRKITIITVCLMIAAFIGFQRYKLQSYHSLVQMNVVQETEENIKNVLLFSRYLENISKEGEEGVSKSLDVVAWLLMNMTEELDDTGDKLGDTYFYRDDLQLDDMNRKLRSIARTIQEYASYEGINNVPESLISRIQTQSEYLKDVDKEVNVENLTLDTIGDTLRQFENAFEEPADWEVQAN